MCSGCVLGPWADRPVGTVAVLSLHSSAPGVSEEAWAGAWCGGQPALDHSSVDPWPHPARRGLGGVPPPPPQQLPGFWGPRCRDTRGDTGKGQGPAKGPETNSARALSSLSRESTDGFYFPGRDFYHCVCRATNTYFALRGEKRSPVTSRLRELSLCHLQPRR